MAPDSSVRRLAVFVFSALLSIALGARSSSQPDPGLTLQFTVGQNQPGAQPGRFVYPSGVAVDSEGRFLVADTEEYDLADADGDGNFDEVVVDGNRIQIFSPDGTLEGVLGRSGGGAGEFWYPTAVAVDALDQIVVVDSGNNRIQVFTPAGAPDGPHVLAQYGSYGNYDALDPWSEVGPAPMDALYFPTGAALKPGTRLLDPTDQDGRLAIVDNGNHRVIVLDAQLRPVMEFGGHGFDDRAFGSLEYPWGIAIDAEGRYFVTEPSNHRVQVFDASGEFLWAFGNEEGAQTSAPWHLSAPSAIALDRLGRLLVADTDRSRVLRVDTGSAADPSSWLPRCRELGASRDAHACVLTASNGRSYEALVVGEYGTGRADFRFPSGLAVDRSGRVAVVDTGNHQLKVFEPARIQILAASATGLAAVGTPIALDVKVANRATSELIVSVDVAASLPGTLRGQTAMAVAPNDEQTFTLEFVPGDAGSLTFEIGASGVADTGARATAMRSMTAAVAVRPTPVPADLEPPVTSLTTSVAPSPTGWHAEPFTVTLTADDHGGAGVKSISWRARGMRTFAETTSANPASFSITGVFQGLTEITFFATDRNGNQERPQVATLWLDSSGPYMGRAVLSPSPNAAGWNRTDTTVSFVAGDDRSGIDWVTAPISVTAEGAGQLVEGASRDRAGHEAHAEPVAVNIDKTPPTLTYSVEREPDRNGWYNYPVTVSFSATDKLSGLARVSPSQTISEDGIFVVKGTATDLAGNVTEAEVTIKMDRTPPTMECRTANGDAVWPPNHLLVPWETSVVLSDVTSQPGGFTLVSVSSSDPDLGRGDGNTSGDIQGFVIGTPDTSGFVRAERSGLGGARTYTAVYEGRDQAGNVASCSIVTTFVPHDQRDKNRLR